MEFFQPENDIILNYSDAESCEGPLTEKECPEALKNMDREKSPGSDKLHADFHQIFRKDLSSVLINVLNFAYDRSWKSLDHSETRNYQTHTEKDAELHARFIKIGAQ